MLVLWSISKPSGIEGVEAHAHVGDGQLATTGKGGGFVERARRERGVANARLLLAVLANRLASMVVMKGTGVYHVRVCAELTF